MGPNITKPRGAEPQQPAAAVSTEGGGLRRVASSPALLAMAPHGAAADRGESGAELAELQCEVAELREHVEDLESKVSCGRDKCVVVQS